MSENTLSVRTYNIFRKKGYEHAQIAHLTGATTKQMKDFLAMYNIPWIGPEQLENVFDDQIKTTRSNFVKNYQMLKKKGFNDKQIISLMGVSASTFGKWKKELLADELRVYNGRMTVEQEKKLMKRYANLKMLGKTDKEIYKIFKIGHRTLIALKKKYSSQYCNSFRKQA